MKKTFLTCLLPALMLIGCGGEKQQATSSNDRADSTQTTVPTEVQTPEQNPENAQDNDEQPAMSPDFTLNDIDGKPLSLSNLQGKYVVLDFWGTWCGWCIKGIPDMKEMYAKYSDKLEILSVDCGDSEEAWKEAVAEYEMPWKHVYNSENDGVAELYSIQGFPTKIVIDPQGCIVKKFEGEVPEFYTFIAELMK